MGFTTVLQAVHIQLKNSNNIKYVFDKHIYLGPKEIPDAKYSIFIEPLSEEEKDNTRAGNVKHLLYTFNIFAGMVVNSTAEVQIFGDGKEKGILDFTEDIKTTIKENLNFGLNANGYSRSKASTITSYALTANNKYISVSLDNKTPAGYNLINCGDSTLTGTEIAANIQVSLRALGNSVYPRDPYNLVICTYDNTNKRFTITSKTDGGRSTVVVTSGNTDDCTAILGFDNPTEERGINIVSTFIPRTQFFVDVEKHPVRYAVITVNTTEEVYSL